MPASIDEKALLEAIHRVPEEDTPRLAYADWLDEHGDPDRATFIRLQIELAAYSPYDSKANKLREQVKALWDTHEERWTVPFAPADEVTFSRGFADRVMVDLEKLAKHPNILAAGPFGCLCPSTPANNVAVTARIVARNPLLARVPSLNVVGWAPAELRHLLRSPHLTGLTALHFDDSCCAPPFARLVANCENLRSLVHIGFYGDYEGRLGNRGVASLAGAQHLASVRSLNLQNNKLKDNAMVTLAKSKYLKGLEYLSLGWGSYSENRIGSDGAEAIANSANFAKLKSLDLAFSGFGDAGLVAFAKSRHLAAIESLNVPASGAGDEGIMAFVQHRGMPRLQFLNISSGGLTDEGMIALAKSKRLAVLTEFKAGSTSVSDAGAKALADSPHAVNLKKLNLHQCSLSKAGVEALLDSQNLSGLIDLSISTESLPKTLQARLKKRFGE